MMPISQKQTKEAMEHHVFLMQLKKKSQRIHEAFVHLEELEEIKHNDIQNPDGR